MKKTNYFKYYNKYRTKYCVTKSIKIFFDGLREEKPYRIKIEKVLCMNSTESMKIEYVDTDMLYVKIFLNSLDDETITLKTIKDALTVA